MLSMNFEELLLRLTSGKRQCFGAGATDSDVELAEIALGVPIHGSYRRFVARFGWGGVEHLELYGLGEDVPPHLDLVRVTESERTEMYPPLPRHLLPVMNDGAGNLYCVDTMSPPGSEPRVVLWSHECGAGQVAETVAKDFTTWLHAVLNELGVPRA